MYIKKCRACESKKLISVLNFGKQPWCNDFIKKKWIGKEKEYPLHLVYCKACTMIQLNYTVAKETMFSNHTYLSSTTKTLKNFFLKLAKENKKQFKLKAKDKILDIGGNDGIQMMQYKKIGLKNVVNVESASNISKISKKNGIKTFNNFFNYKFVKKKIPKKSIKVVNASGVFFHLEELHSVLKAVEYVLNRDGVLIVQFMYLGSIIDQGTFDSIYHEHLLLYTVNSLSKLLSRYNMEIFDCYHADIHSGSIIAKACLKDSINNKKTSRFKKTYKKDLLYDLKKLKKFARNSKKKSNSLKSLILKLSKNNKIYCYGAPAKGNTLINFMNLNLRHIKKVVEVNPLKIGRYTPKSNIPIIKETAYDLPDYYLLLSHNFAKEILKKNKDLIFKKKVKFILPFPKIKIISRNNYFTFIKS